MFGFMVSRTREEHTKAMVSQFESISTETAEIFQSY